VLWFGYDGYDCPHVEATTALATAGLKIVAVSDNLPAKLPANIMASVPLGSTSPEHIAAVPFNTEGAGSATSVDALLHYLWIRRLVSLP